MISVFPFTNFVGEIIIGTIAVSFGFNKYLRDSSSILDHPTGKSASTVNEISLVLLLTTLRTLEIIIPFLSSNVGLVNLTET